MPAEHYLHDHPDFTMLLRIVGQARGIEPHLVEKDYWIMHCLYSLGRQGFTFELKGGTSLSKGYRIIHRFSEDIDIRIHPPAGLEVKTGKNQDKPAHVDSRFAFYDWLADKIAIEGVVKVARDHAFDDPKARSGGIRLHYQVHAETLAGLKDGILLELGFDDTTPHTAVTITSWAYDYASGRGVACKDNRAVGVPCYNPEYTFVEKLQTISTKFRQQQTAGALPANFLRHYYDVAQLLGNARVQAFIGTETYEARKRERFRQEDVLEIATNEAFLLSNPVVRTQYQAEFAKTKDLYYQGQPDFEWILARILADIGRL